VFGIVFLQCDITLKAYHYLIWLRIINLQLWISFKRSRQTTFWHFLITLMEHGCYILRLLFPTHKSCDCCLDEIHDALTLTMDKCLMSHMLYDEPHILAFKLYYPQTAKTILSLLVLHAYAASATTSTSHHLFWPCDPPLCSICAISEKEEENFTCWYTLANFICFPISDERLQRMR
jgi:hypothetical protein